MLIFLTCFLTWQNKLNEDCFMSDHFQYTFSHFQQFTFDWTQASLFPTELYSFIDCPQHCIILIHWPHPLSSTFHSSSFRHKGHWVIDTEWLCSSSDQREPWRTSGGIFSLIFRTYCLWWPLQNMHTHAHAHSTIGYMRKRSAPNRVSHHKTIISISVFIKYWEEECQQHKLLTISMLIS